jgi:hypothetical protein
MNATLREQMLACAETLVNDLATWTHDHPDADFDAREARVLEQGRRVLRDLLGLVAGAAGRRTPACPQCGVRSVRPVRRRRPRTVQSRCGPVRIPRDLLTCRGCGTHWRPVDGVLRLAPKQRTSVGVQRWAARLGGLTTFAEGAALLDELTGVALGTETLRTHAERIGTELEGRQQGTMAHVQAEQAPPPARYAPVPTCLVVEADGAMVRYRDRHLDGTPLEGDWHEAKLGLTAGWQDGVLVAPSYVAAREPAVRFARRLGAEAACRGALDVIGWRGAVADGGGHEAVLRRVLVLGDGARWIWEEVAASFGGERVEVVDWYHASQHLWTLAKALHGEGTAAATTWAEQATHLLWRHGPDPLLALLRATEAPTPTAAKTLATERGYFARNAARMQYPTLRRQGLPVGSGAVESEAKRLVQLRLKRPGMRWSDLGARAILHLRCHSLSGHATEDLPLAA